MDIQSKLNLRKKQNSDIGSDASDCNANKHKTTDIKLNKHPEVAAERRLDSTLAAANKLVKLNHVGAERPECTDTLHRKTTEPANCAANYCLGSAMDTDVLDSELRSREEVRLQAKEFIDDFYQSTKRLNTLMHANRLEEIETEISNLGRYDLTIEELTYGARTSWRNAARCINRIHWSKMQVFDARHVTTTKGMFEAICKHLKYATNNGILRSAMTVFPARTDMTHDFRVWNQQYIRYAGYKQSDGSIVGDPANVDLTQTCQRLGWSGKGTMFDVLPLILQANGGQPELFEIPSELVLEVPIKHPEFPKVEEMGVKWCAVPAVSNMALDCGGLIFPAAPFSGWFMGTEIGARNLCDPFRYNLLEEFAIKMGFDTRNCSSLWKDRTIVEVNVAVLHSYQSKGVKIVDHHTASAGFMKHLDKEQKLRGGCPADWIWIVPPISGSAVSVFHQEMLVYKLKPSLEYLVDPCKAYICKKKNEDTSSSRRTLTFKALVWTVIFTARLNLKALARRVRCVILYATETGKSEEFANRTHNIFRQTFDAKVMCMDDYDVSKLENESLVLIVASTSGSGEPPENGQTFADHLFQIQNKPRKDRTQEQVPNGFIGRTSGVVTSSKQNDKGSGFLANIRTKEQVPNGFIGRTGWFATRSKQNDKGSAFLAKIRIKEQVPNGIIGRTSGVVTSSNQNGKGAGFLAKIRYSVFGLGNSTYCDTYCTFGHSIDDNLKRNGAQQIYKMVEGDEIQGQEESFTSWSKHVFKAACEEFCIRDEQTMQFNKGALSMTDPLREMNRFRVTTPVRGTETDVSAALSRLHRKKVVPCRVIQRKPLQSPESSRETILIKLDTTFGSADMLYEPGEHVSIFPENPAKLVTALLKRLHNAPPPDQLMHVEILNEKTLPGSKEFWSLFTRLPLCTLRTAFSRLLDITTPPSQPLLMQLSIISNNEKDRKRLEMLANDSKLYAEWKYGTYPNIVEVMNQFPSLRMPASLLLTQLPLLIPRLYSISSSQKSSPGEIHATVAIIKYMREGMHETLHEGVASSWLNRVAVGESIPCVIRHYPAFRMPADPTLPMILVATGSGIAPFRSFWHERKVDMETLPIPHHDSRKGWGDTFLYFGCRSSQLDNIYKDELSELKKARVLKDVFIALSREAGIPKTYVQNILKKNASDVFKCLAKHAGHIYICGDINMANDVKHTLEKILIAEGHMTKAQANTFMMTLKESKRLHIDVFSVVRRGVEVTNGEVTNGLSNTESGIQEVTHF